MNFKGSYEVDEGRRHFSIEDDEGGNLKEMFDSDEILGAFDPLTEDMQGKSYSIEGHILYSSDETPDGTEYDYEIVIENERLEE